MLMLKMLIRLYCNQLIQNSGKLYILIVKFYVHLVQVSHENIYFSDLKFLILFKKFLRLFQLYKNVALLLVFLITQVILKRLFMKRKNRMESNNRHLFSKYQRVGILYTTCSRELKKILIFWKFSWTIKNIENMH